MKKHRLHNFVLGMVIVALLASLAVPALAVTGRKQMEVDYMGIKLAVDGIPTPARDANGNEVEPFASGGTTYLPVRAVGEALGMDVRWDGPTHTVYITTPAPAMSDTSVTKVNVQDYAHRDGNQRKKTIEVDYLDIKLVVNDKEVTPKDANGNVVEPFAYNGTTYLPVRAVGEALGKSVRWEGETKTVHLGELPQATYLVDVCKTTHEEKVYRAADGKAFTVDGKSYSQGFYGSMTTFELGGKYESLTFDVISDTMPQVYLDGELAQEIEMQGTGKWQTVTIPLNYAQLIEFDHRGDGRYTTYIANAVLHGERTVTKPVPPANATYLVDVCTASPDYSVYKAAEGKYYEDWFGNKYTNGISPSNTKVQLNGRYNILKATLVGKHGVVLTENIIETLEIYVDGIKVLSAPSSSTIEVPLNYGMELTIIGDAAMFLADMILE